MSKIRLTAEQFLALSKSEQRIVLAKDVIDILQSNKITAKRCAYFEMYGHSKKDEINELVGKTPCKVCALGGLFVAEVMYTDRATIGDADNRFFIKDRLNEYFEERQLGLIESAFEGTAEFCDGKGYSEDEVEAAINFVHNNDRYRDQYIYPEDAMMLIMQNIVEHNGDFVP